MKKIVIVINNMRIGGIQKSLVELLKCIKEKYSVFLYCVLPEGDLLKDVPSEVTILPINTRLLCTELSMEEAKQKGFYVFLQKICGNIWCKVFSKKIPARILTRCVKIPGQYDVAVSFTQPTSSKLYYNLSNEIVLYSCQAKKKYTFLHCDFANYGGNDRVNRSLYKHFDGVISVSESVGKSFIQVVPEMAKKITTIYNCCDPENIIKLANIDSVNYSEQIPIVTVARISKEKGLLRCIDIIHDLALKGFDIKWHIVGDGEEKKAMQEMIEARKLGDIIILHGETDNPYRYMKNARLFFLPSLHEAAPMVYNETAVLGVPILTTRTLSAIEIVDKNNYGWVCNNSVEAIKESLYKICLKMSAGEKKRITPIDYNIKAIKAFERIVDYI